MWDSSIFSSIKPKYDKRLFVYFCVFPQIYLSCTKNCFILMFRTIFGATQVNLWENTKVNKQSLVIFWLIWRKYGSVSHSLSCKWQKIKWTSWEMFLTFLLIGAVNPAQLDWIRAEFAVLITYLDGKFKTTLMSLIFLNGYDHSLKVNIFKI